MKHHQFAIGQTFWCGGNRWRCTDIGTRVITAISLEPCETVSYCPDPHDPTKGTSTTYLCDDPRRLNGPPYSILESVFDEYDQHPCSLTPEES